MLKFFVLSCAALDYVLGSICFATSGNGSVRYVLDRIDSF